MAKQKAPFKDERTLTEKRAAEAHDALTRAEDNLARALTRWQTARRAVKYYHAKLDKAKLANWPELAKSAEKIRDPWLEEAKAAFQAATKEQENQR